MPFSRAEVLRIRDGSAHAFVDDTLVWQLVNGALRGTVNVVTDAVTGGVQLMANISPGRPNQPTFLLRIRGEHCHRLDVNTPHRDIKGTHLQWRDDSDDREQTRDAANEFPPISATGAVGATEYAATFRAFAKYLGIDVSQFVWVDPPEVG